MQWLTKSLQLRFEALNRVRLSNFCRKIIPEKRGMIGKGPAARLLFSS